MEIVTRNTHQTVEGRRVRSTVHPLPEPIADRLPYRSPNRTARKPLTTTNKIMQVNIVKEEEDTGSIRIEAIIPRPAPKIPPHPKRRELSNLSGLLLMGFEISIAEEGR